MFSLNYQSNFSNKFKLLTNRTWPDWSTIIIWIIGLIFLSFLTLNDILPIFNDYQHKNVATQIAVIKNITIRPPNMTVCIPYYSGSLSTIATWIVYDRGYVNGTIFDRCLECEAMSNRSWDIWTDMDFDEFRERKDAVTAIGNTIATNLIKKFLDDQYGFEILQINRTNFNWNQPILDAVWMFLSCTTRQDIFFISNTISSLHRQCIDFNFTVIGNVDSDLIDRFYESVIDSIEIYYHSTVSPYQEFYKSATSINSSLRNHKSLTIKGYYFCFPLLDNSETELFQYTPFHERIPPPWLRFVRKGPFTVFYDPSVLYGSVDLTEALYNTEKSTGQSLHKLNVSAESVSLTYTITTGVVETRPNKKSCSKENTPTVCVAKRLAEKAIDYCNCLPFTFRNLISNRNRSLVYCNHDLYSDHSCHDRLRNNLQTFISECNDKCEYFFYKWKHTFSLQPIDESSNFSFNIRIQSIIAPFVQFRLTIRDTPEKFLAQMGGLINLYLGFNGLSVCAMVVFSFNVIKRCIHFRKTKKIKSIGKTEIISTISRTSINENRLEPNKDRKVTNEGNDKIEKIMEKIMKKWREEDNEKMTDIQNRLDDQNKKIDSLLYRFSLKEKNVLELKL